MNGAPEVEGVQRNSVNLMFVAPMKEARGKSRLSKVSLVTAAKAARAKKMAKARVLMRIFEKK